MKRGLFGLAIVLMSMAFAACSDDYVVPDYKRELCLFTYNGVGKNSEFTTDAGQHLLISTPVNFDLKTDTAYRMMITYALEDNPSYAALYGLMQVPMLGDSTANAFLSDTLTNVSSIWKGGGFINLALDFKHNGMDLKQSFGYRINRVDHKGEHAHHHLTLFYRQNNVFPYYTYTYNFSIRPSDMQAEEGDTVTFHTLTKGPGPGGQQVVNTKDFTLEI